MNRHAAIVTRLLGPAQPELLCDECFEKLDEYVELELSGVEVDEALPGLGAHLEGCEACREDYDSLRELVARPRPSAYLGAP